MRKVIRVSAVLLVLAGNTYGGDMPNGTPLPTGPGNMALEPAAGGLVMDEAQAGVSPLGAADDLAQVMMELLALLPSVF